MGTKNVVRTVAAALSMLIAFAAGPIGQAVAQQEAAEPTNAQLLERIEALEKALAELRKQPPGSPTAATAACEPAESPASRPASTVAVKRAPAGEAPPPATTQGEAGGVSTSDVARSDAPAVQAAGERPAVEAKPAKATAGYKDGYFIASGDGSYKLKLGGYLQADGRSFVDGGSDDVNQFTIRRARLDLRGTLATRFGFRLMPDFSDSDLTLQDAYVEADFAPWLELRAGKFKTPFGLERLQGSTDLPFVERGLTSNLAPGRDVGVRLGGDVWDGRLDYKLAVLNGVPDGDDGDTDVNDAVDVVARLFATPFSTSMYSPFRGVGVGLAATYGREQGSSSNEQLPKFKTAGRATFFRYTEEGDDAVADGDHYRVSPQALWYEGSFGLLTEYVRSSQQVSRDDERAWVANDAWQIRSSYLLTGEKASMDGVVPNAPFDFGGGHWGAWELALRWSSLDVDNTAFKKGFADPAESARHADGLATAINWYLNRNVALYLHYEHTTFGGGDDTGDRENEDVFLTRMQVVF